MPPRPGPLPGAQCHPPTRPWGPPSIPAPAPGPGLPGRTQGLHLAVMETYISTCISARRYERLSEVVELLFPPVARGPSTDLAHPEYSNFCYWREPLAPVDLDALA